MLSLSSQLAMGHVQVMFFSFLTLLYISVGASATEYTSSGGNCSYQPPLGTISKGSYYGSVDASCPQPLKPWRSLKAPCKPKVNRLMPKAGGTWYKTDDGLYNWEPKDCTLPRLTTEMARQCLSHKTLAFVGDSVTRYQYVSLAYWLSKAAQLDPFADNVTIPSLAHEYQWQDWPTFWKGLVQALSCATDAEAQATCHGHRNTTIPFTEIFERHELRLHFKRKPAGWLSKAGTVPARLIANMAMKAPDYRRNLHQSLEDAMRSGRPDVLVLNGGIWYEGKHAGYPVDNMTDVAKEEFLEMHKELLELGNKLKAELSLKTLFIWKTTTKSSEMNETSWSILQDMLGQAALDHGWEVLDVRSISAAARSLGMNVYIDSFHFMPFVYQQFNDLLLYQICEGHVWN